MLKSALILFVLFFLPFSKLSAAESRSAVDLYDIGEDLLLLIPREQSVIIELREYFHAEVIDRVEIRSPYLRPTYKLQNVVASDVSEVLVESRSGGTGTAATMLSIYVVTNHKLVLAGEFILERSENQPSFNFESETKGSVEFLPAGRILYRWRTTGHDGKTVLADEGNDLYEYNGKYVKLVSK